MQNNNQNKKIAMLGADKYKMSARDVVLPYAIASWQQQAGYIARKMPVSSASMSQYETQPYCSDAAANYLRDMLERIHTPALAEWVLLMSQTGQLAPPEYLPTLLELGKADKFMRPYIVNIGGNRILWFAEQDDSRTARWVSKIAVDVPYYLRQSYIQACEFDAWMIGSWVYDTIHRRRYEDIDSPAIEGDPPMRFIPYPKKFQSPDLFATEYSWSVPLSEVFMERAYAKNFHYSEAQQVAYKLSLNIKAERLQAWQNVVCKKYTESRAEWEQVMPIIEYRRKMRQAIEAIA